MLDVTSVGFRPRISAVVTARIVRVPGRPHCAVAAGVDQDVRLGDGRVGDAVDVGQEHAGAAPGAAGAPGLGDQGGDLAVLGAGDLDPRRGARAVAGGEVLLHAVE